MDKQDKLQQEILILKEELRQEKLKKAEELLAHRLVYSAIIFVILFIALVVALDGESNVVQWLCIIPFWGVVLYVVGRISVHYSRDKEEAHRG